MSKVYVLQQDLPYAKAGAEYFKNEYGDYRTTDLISIGNITHDTLHKDIVENDDGTWFKLKEQNKEWEIVAVRRDGANLNVQYGSEFQYIKGDVIITVKRLSDGEVFTVGDKIVGFGDKPVITISKFEVDYFNSKNISAYHVNGYGKGYEVWKKVDGNKKYEFENNSSIVFHVESGEKIAKAFNNEKAHLIATALNQFELKEQLPVDKDAMIIKADNICPVTQKLCNDECCPPGAVCNISSMGGIRPSQEKEQPPVTDAFQWTDELVKEFCCESFKLFDVAESFSKNGTWGGIPKEVENFKQLKSTPKEQPKEDKVQWSSANRYKEGVFVGFDTVVFNGRLFIEENQLKDYFTKTSLKK